MVDFGRAQAVLPRVRVISKGKADGRRRRLAVPPEPLMGLLKRLAKQLTETLYVHDAAVGFRKGVSTADAARIHEGCRTLVHLDLRDFFEQVRRGAVARTLSKVYTPDAVSALCALATYKFDDGDVYVLPQGFPTSPALSNAALYEVDEFLDAAARQQDWRYCRYADDLFLSGPDARARDGLIRHAEDALTRALGFGALVGCTRHVMDLDAGSVACKVLGYLVAPRFSFPRHLRRKLEWWAALDKRGKLPVDRSEAHGLARYYATAEPERAAPFVAQFSTKKKGTSK
jgi:RNA-directed DNA polymerase